MSFKTWEEYTPLEQAAITYSDLYKDVHGIRPRFTADWTIEDYDNAFVSLEKEANDRFEYEAAEEAEAIESFERLVEETIQLGAADRETAIRWILSTYNEYQIEEFTHDPHYFNWEHGMPYSYDWKTGKEIA